MLFLSCHFAVEALFGKLVDWFALESRTVCGDKAFCDAYFRIEHFLQHNPPGTKIESLYYYKLQEVLVETAMSRDHLIILSWDPRWSGLTANYLAELLDHDELPIVNEIELLSICERWNCDRDKKKEDVLKVCQCFRQSPDNLPALVTYLSTLGRRRGSFWRGDVVCRGYDCDCLVRPEKMI